MLKRDSEMKVATSYRHAAQFIQLVIGELLVAHRSHLRFPLSLCEENGFQAHDWPWVRMYVLQRDRYRCRACHRRGDEITLHVDLIKPVPANVNALMTLCTSCHRTAQDWKSSGSIEIISIKRRIDTALLSLLSKASANGTCEPASVGRSVHNA
jgi:Zn finger protein HypA/HybF involved in hydrogenase expression